MIFYNYTCVVVCYFLFSISIYSNSSTKDSKYKIVATTGMIKDIVENVVGDNANVVGIIGDGVDPHLYKPSSSDVKQFYKADVIFYNGLMLEGKLSDILIKMARKGKLVYPVTEEILDNKDYVIIDSSDHYDPHVWMDVKGWIHAVKIVYKAISNYDKKNTEEYKKRSSEYIKKLERLEAYVKKSINSIPKEKRILVTAHDAFSYMSRAYGLEVRGIQGISTESEAGIKDIEDLISFLVDKKIPAIFVESSVSDKNVKALAEGANAQGHKVVIGGELFSDAMGPSNSYEGTYIGMIDHNVTTISRSLGGNAPKKGLNGKLTIHK